MADKEHRLTDKKLEEMERHLSAIYSRANKEIGEEWTKYLEKSTKEIDELQKAYDKAKKSGDFKEANKINKKLQKAKKEQTLKNRHFKEIEENTAKELANVNKTSLAYINGELPEVYALNYNALKSEVDGVGGYAFSLVDSNTVKNLATTDKSLLPFKEIDEKKDIRWNVKKMNAEILQGIIQGEAMDKIAGRLQNVTNMNATTAIRNARTMITGAENKGRLDSYTKAEADGIILQKEWLSSDDKRTRHAHFPDSFDSLVVDTDKPFSNDIGKIMYPGDPTADPANVYNCRCSMAAVVKGFKKVR